MSLASCPPEWWPVFSRLLDEALELPESARGAWLAEVRSRHAQLAPWLESVLSRNDIGDDYLQRPRMCAMAPSDAQAGQRIGPYVLVREIGSGGMGVVWLATRSDGQLRREIALKLPHAHLLAGKVGERFARERDILAALNHPHIATLYDAGLAENGRPYLALEAVDGQPITQWCQAHKATLEQRLDLMQQVMDAVQYAHARLIVHRDLKPSNVLVNAQGQVKLLDFGIAKLLIGDTGLESVQSLTREGERVATPGYATPEQMQGGAITTKVDIYTLGVMLYELLCGERPPPPIADDLQRSDSRAADLPLCSTRVSDAFAASVGELRAMTLRRQLRGDLDAILATALMRDPDARYASVEAFAADLQRYRAHLPIKAKRVSRARLAAKFLRRHRAVSITVSVLIAALLASTIFVWLEAQRERAQRERAEAVSRFIQTMFRNADPRVSLKPQTAVGDLLQAGAQSVLDRPALGAPMQAQLLVSIAKSMQSLGMYEPAHGVFQRAFDLDSTPDVRADIVANLAYNDLEWGDDRYAAADKRIAEELLQTPGLSKLAQALAHFAACLNADNLSQSESCEAHLRAAFEARQELAESDPDVLGTLLLVRGENLTNQHDYAAASEILRDAVNELKKIHGPDHPQTLRAQLTFADNQMSLHILDTEPLIAHAAEQLHHMLGANHHDTLDAENELARLYLAQGRTQEAMVVFQSLIEPSRALYGEEGFNIAISYVNVGLTAMKLNDPTMARDYMQRTVRALQGHPTEADSEPSVFAKSGVALLDCMQQHDEARLQALQALRDQHHANVDLSSYLDLELNQCRVALGQRAQARAELPKVIVALRDYYGETNSTTRIAETLLEQLQHDGP
jgi:serine/threonine-protein kinase